MSKLNIDQQTIFQLFSDKKSDFIIPDYQRPYAWGEDECNYLYINNAFICRYFALICRDN